MLYRILFLAIFTLVSARVAFSSPLEVNVGEITDYLPQATAPVLEHFVKSPDTNVIFKNLDKDIAKSEKFLKAVADDAARIGPRGTITLETTNKALVDAFQKQINRGRYAKDITVTHVPPACGIALSPFGFSVSDFVKVQQKNLADFEKYLYAQRVKMTPYLFGEGVREAWEYIETPSTVPGKTEQSFRILTVEGGKRQGKTTLLNGLAGYLGNHDIGAALSAAQPLGKGKDLDEQRQAIVPFGRVALLKLNYNPASGTFFDNETEKLLEAAFQLHDGSFPLVLIIDSMDWVNPNDSGDIAIGQQIDKHIGNLKGKEDSFKVIFALNPERWNAGLNYSPYYNPPGMYLKEYIETHIGGTQRTDALFNPLPPIFIEQIAIQL